MQANAERVLGLEQRLSSAEGRERVEILAELATVIGESDPAGSRDSAEEACRLGEALPGCEEAVATASLCLAMYLARQSKFSAAVDRAGRAREIYESLRHVAGLGDVARTLGNIQLYRGDSEGSREHFQNSLDAARSLDDPAREMRALLGLATSARLSGNLLLAESLYRQCIALDDRAGDREAHAKALFQMQVTLLEQGKVAEGVEALLQCQRLFEDLGDQEGLTASWALLGQLYKELGRYARARECLEEALAIARTTERPSTEVRALLDLAEVFQASEDEPSALRCARKALAISSMIEVETPRASALLRLGRIFLSLGRMSEAGRAIEEAHELRSRSPDRAGLGESFLVRAGLFRAKGMHRRAMYDLEDALRIAREGGSRAIEADAYFERGATLLEGGNSESAAEELEAGLEIAADLFSTRLRAKFHRSLSVAYRDLGRHDAALEHYIRYHEITSQAIEAEHQDRLEKLDSIQDVEQARREAQAQKELNEKLTALNDDLTRANTDLAQANRVKNQVLEIVAHDLRNPLTAVQGFATLGLIRAREASDTSLEGMFEKIASASQNAHEILQGLIDTQVLEEGKVPLESGTVDLRELAKESISDHRGPADRKRIPIDLDDPGSPVEATGDRRAIRQVLDNLVSNAIKFSPKGARIRLRVAQGEEGPEVTVTDGGPGIPADERDLLFTKFGRLSSRPTGDETSTGLGLYTVKLLVTAMFGRVSLESTSGKGAAFRVVLPGPTGSRA